MSDVQRWAEGFRGGGVRAADGEYVTYADHARIVAEMEVGIAALLLAREQAHAAVLAEAKAVSYADGRVDGMRAVALLVKPRTLTADENCPTCGRAGDA